MKLSIIVPVYGVEKYIERCVSSLLVHDNNDYEIIIIDDETKDKSIDIIREKFSDSRIRIIHQKNAGLSAARNHGIEEAKGDYVWCFDSDDWAESDQIHKILELLDDCDVLALSHYYLNYEDTGDEVLRGYNVKANSGLELICQVFQSCAPYYIYKRELLLSNDIKFKVGILHEDNLFTAMALPQMKILKIFDPPVYHHRIRSGSITQVVAPKRLIDLLYIIDELLKFGKTISLNDRYKWGACVVGTLNHLLFLSNKISDHEVNKMISLRINNNKEILKYLLNTRSLNNRVWGYFSCLLLGKITIAYNILYRFRYLFS